MLIDTGSGVSIRGLNDASQSAIEAEKIGYDGIFTAEINHDPFLPLVIASQVTKTIDLGTSIAVAFARNPMTTAMLGWDLQAWSQGRMILGLGSQVKTHIRRRFSMPWSQPADRMREFIQAMHAIWESWETGDVLKYRGKVYTHTLMPPFWRPEPHVYGPPRVFLGAVGPLMTGVAGEVADGMVCHGLTTERYLREFTLPILRDKRRSVGKSLDGFEIQLPAFVVTGTTQEEMEESARGTCKQIAFYASTDAYRPVLEMHGWGDLQSELKRLSIEGEWDQMGHLIDDSMLKTFAVVAEPQHLAKDIKARFGDVVTRLCFYAPYDSNPEVWLPVLEELKR